LRVIEVETAAGPEQARNAGLAAARGHYVIVLDGSAEVAAGSFDARLRAHRLGYAMVSGPVANAAHGVPSWAAHFLSNSTVLPGWPTRELTAPPAACSYLRAAMIEVGGAGEHPTINAELFMRGFGAYHEAAALTLHHAHLTTVDLLRREFDRGRAVGASLIDQAEERAEFPDRWIVRYVFGEVPRRVKRITVDVFRYGGSTRLQYLLALPLVIAGAMSAWLGGCWQMARQVPMTIRSVRRQQRTLGRRRPTRFVWGQTRPADRDQE
jgi:hypothetical protein